MMNRYQLRIRSYIRACLILEGIAIFLVVWLGICYASRLMPGGSVGIAQKINPNTACAASLERLPNIGPQRAEAIIDYRNQFDPEEPVFICPDDLQQVRGIGPKTVESLRPWLSFDVLEAGE
ncbi:MAG: ComEA family DNA-binding protein [Sedimentisphaerales bacterium]|nr:ComEA family DNA-binding protein [Sedimentisphaerales bacterium]